MKLRRKTIGPMLMALPICIGLVWGCDKDDTVQRYEVAKTADAPVTNDAPAPTAPVADTAAPIHWTVPAGWKQLPGNDMRYASFAVSPDHPDLQLTVVPLAGSGGSLISNINRWEGQIGLPPSSEEDLKELITPITVAGSPVALFDRTGVQPADRTPPKRILAAILAHGDRTWFLKLAGPNDVVQSQKANFDSFVQSIRFDDTPQMPSDMGSVAAAPAPPGVSTDSGLPITFALPPGWQQEVASQSSPFRVVAFNVASGTDTAEAVVTHVVKDSGTMLDNINRWRGQVGLDPVEDADKVPSEKITLDGAPATIWDFENTASARRMRLAMVTHGTDWWFFKLGGASPLVAAQKTNFNSFVASIRFRNNTE